MEKRPVEIEKLLHWAYRDELPKRETSSAEGIWDRIEEFGQRGGIDVGQGAAQRYPHFGLPHRDAERIERAVGGLQHLIIDWDRSREAIMGRLAALLTARDVLLVRTLNTAALVTMHSKMGTRPNWHEETPRPYPVPPAKGKARAAIVGECRGKNRYTIGSYCPVRWMPSPVTIAAARADYACWHRGLTTIAETIELEDHVALPPAAPAQPWQEGAPPPGRVFAVGEPGAKLPLKPQRPFAGPLERRRLGSAVRKPVDKGSQS